MSRSCPIGILLLTGLVLTGLGGLACRDLDRYRECQRVAEVANPMLSEIAAAAKQEPSARLYGETAAKYARLKRALRGLTLNDSRVSGALDTYIEMVEAAEKQLRQSGKELSSSKDQNKEKATPAELQQRHEQAIAPVLAQQTSAMSRIRSLCKP